MPCPYEVGDVQGEVVEMTPEERRREILAQPSAMKEVYSPPDHYVNGHVVRVVDGDTIDVAF